MQKRVIRGWGHISGIAEARHQSMCGVCNASDATIANLLWPLVLRAMINSTTSYNMYLSHKHCCTMALLQHAHVT